MALDYRPQTVTAEQYQEIFELERAIEYPVIDALEARLGYAIDRRQLEELARVLSCPFKAKPPNWQHGRVIYAVARHYCENHPSSLTQFVDIGTAKGFSALCAYYAGIDSGATPSVWSCDVMGPEDRVRRSTPAEVESLKTLKEILQPWSEYAVYIHFTKDTGQAMLSRELSGKRIHFAFIDGKHSTEAVGAEWRLLSARQESGDIAIFDDIQMQPVRAGLAGAEKAYSFEKVALGVIDRAYAIGVRR